MQLQLPGSLGRVGARRSRTRALSLAVLTAALTCLGLYQAGAARADAYELCAGYTACSIGGYSTHGYEYAEGTMWWRMYAGDNCTNYAAYVESQIYGVPEPAGLLGDGGQWAANAAAQGIPVDTTPTVGSVAEWDADTPSMGGYGHVAIVEAVGADDSYIDVSQSGMGASDDGFDWERIYADGGSWEPWPSSFIHFSGTRMPATFPQPGNWLPGAEIVVPGA
jgi:surface antigen